MAGGTLMLSSTIMLHPHYKKLLEDFGFANVAMTSLERDGLYSFIREMKPNILIVEARFNELSTPYMMLELLEEFPELYTAAYSFEYYSVEHAMCFIRNGVKAYVTASDGMDEYRKGMRLIRERKEYIAPSVIERINLRPEMPEGAKLLLDRDREIIKLTCHSYSEEHIADTLHIVRSTVSARKADIFNSLNIRSSLELVFRASRLGIVDLNDVEKAAFCHRNYKVTPLPEKKKKTAGNRRQVSGNR